MTTLSTFGVPAEDAPPEKGVWRTLPEKFRTERLAIEYAAEQVSAAWCRRNVRLEARWRGPDENGAYVVEVRE